MYFNKMVVTIDRYFVSVRDSKDWPSEGRARKGDSHEVCWSSCRDRHWLAFGGCLCATRDKVTNHLSVFTGGDDTATPNAGAFTHAVVGLWILLNGATAARDKKPKVEQISERRLVTPGVSTTRTPHTLRTHFLQKTQESAGYACVQCNPDCVGKCGSRRMPHSQINSERRLSE